MSFSTFIRRAKKLNIYKPNPGQPENRRQQQSESTWDECSRTEKRRRVLNEQNNKCLHCGVYEWNDTKLILEFDHINGDNTDNSRNNVRFLCPNCHSITPTYRNINRTYIGNKKVSDTVLTNALIEEKNIRQALLKVGLVAKAANYKRAKKLLSRT